VRAPFEGEINCQYCGQRHWRRFACDELIQAAIEHDIRTGGWGCKGEMQGWQREALGTLRDGEANQ